MKKITYILTAMLLTTASAFAQDTSTTTTQQTQTYDTNTQSSHYNENNADRAVQLGADFIMPYRVDSPSGRSAALFGAHAELFLVPAWAVSLEGIFGVEDRGFTDNPIYVAPGMSFYGSPGRTLEPFIRADLPILLNNNQDLGVRGGLGFLWNLGLAGLGLRYSFDATYFFDSETTTLNLAHVSAVLNW